AEHSFLFTEPRNVPCQTDCRTEVVRVIAHQIRRDIRIGRILSNELHLSQVGARGIETSCSRTRWTSQLEERAFVVADNSGVQSAFLKRLSVVLPMNSYIQCEIPAELPIIFEERAHLVLMLLVVLVRYHGRTLQLQVLGTRNSKRLI